MSSRGIGKIDFNYVNVDSVGNAADAGGTTYTTLDSYTLGASVLNRDGDSIEFEYAGSCTAVATNNVKLSFGSALIVPVTFSSAPGGGVGGWVIRGRVIRLTATTQLCYADFGSDTLMTGLYQLACLQDGTETLTSAVILKLEGRGVLADAIVKKYATVKVCGAPS